MSSGSKERSKASIRPARVGSNPIIPPKTIKQTIMTNKLYKQINKWTTIILTFAFGGINVALVSNIHSAILQVLAFMGLIIVSAILCIIIHYIIDMIIFNYFND